MVQITPVILCGGSGSRLWPLSTAQRPKQFLALTSENTMISETTERFQSERFNSPMVIGSLKHHQRLRAELPQAELILEPFGRNSAPAIAAACLASAPEDFLLVSPSDHHIENLQAFLDAIEIGRVAAQSGKIVTFGIKPTHPATGYGYIKATSDDSRVKDVVSFVEKPQKEAAKAYLEEGNYFWNAGIFLFRVEVMLKEIERLVPDLLPILREALSSPKQNTRLLDRVAFERAPNISIDYAVMERAQNIKVVPVDMGWSDLGDYDSLHRHACSSEDDVVSHGPVHISNSRNIYAHSVGPRLVLSGVRDLTIVSTPETVMIVPKGDSEAVKTLGSITETSPHTFGQSKQFRADVKDLLWDILDFWADRAWDPHAGGFVEQLDQLGRPDLSSPRRVRVQARQVFSFARALKYGWPRADIVYKLVSQGLTHIDQNLRNPKSGWVHKVDRFGKPIESAPGLYDHAFIILAGAAAYEAIGDEMGLQVASEAMVVIQSDMKDPKIPGWTDGFSHDAQRRANPHMHLLEASCALYKVTQDPQDLDIAHECVTLFESYFFNPRLDILAEIYRKDWGSVAADSETIFEVGHMYEWASLLSIYDRLTEHNSLSWRERLISSADCYVSKTDTGFGLNAQRPDGLEVNGRSRLWPQLEMLRAHLLHPGLSDQNKAERIFRRIVDKFIAPMPRGLWIDEIDDASNPILEAVPASILYHFITAFEPLIARGD